MPALYKLADFRRQKLLSQEKMAREIGVSVSMYEKIERGDKKVSRGFMEKLKAGYPEISIDEFFFSGKIYSEK